MDTSMQYQNRSCDASSRDRRSFMPRAPSSRGSSFPRKNHVAMMPLLFEEDSEMNSSTVSAKPFVPSYRPSGIQSTTETGNEFESTFPFIELATDTFCNMSSGPSSCYNSKRLADTDTHHSVGSGVEMKNVHAGGYGLSQCVNGNHGTKSSFRPSGGVFASPVKRFESGYIVRGSRSPTPSPAPSLVSSEYSCSLSDSNFPAGITPTPAHIQTPAHSYMQHDGVHTPEYTQDFHQTQTPEVFYSTPALMGGSSSAFRSPSSMQSPEQQCFTPINEDDTSMYFTPNGCNSVNTMFTSGTVASSATKDYQHHSHATLPQCGPDSGSGTNMIPTRVISFEPSSKQNINSRSNIGHSAVPPMPVSPIPVCLPCGYSSPSDLTMPMSTPPPARSSPSTENMQKRNDRSYLATAMRAKDLPAPTSQCTPIRRQRNSTEDSVDPNGSPEPRTSLSPFALNSPTTAAPSSPPLPQNLKGDPHRQAKVKTELCLYFSRGSACPFGARCNYAHGEEELKYTKLEELRQAGLIDDVNAYRAHPCFSWVATGACPFGLRCTNFHDPRVGGTNSSWLPHSDVPVSNLQTDLNVDKKHHQTLATLSQKNPLVHNLIWDLRPSLKKKADATTTNEEEQTEWRDTYSLVCNLASLNTAKKVTSSNLSGLKITELQKLCIAVHMSYSNKNCGIEYVYKPEHVVYNELCMVIRTKYYRLLKPNDLVGKYDFAEPPPIDSVVCEITAEQYQESKAISNNRFEHTQQEVVIVRELAFGCAGEPASRLSLWFEIHDVVELTPQEVKRFKRAKQRVKVHHTNLTKKMSPYPESSRLVPQVRGHSVSARNKAASSFANHPQKPFFHVQPASSEPETLKLIREMLYHRISVLIQREYRAYLGTETEVRDYITAKDSKLCVRFQKLKAAYDRWSWPVTEGRNHVTDETPVPKCSSRYTPTMSSAVSQIWDGFLQADIYDKESDCAATTSKSKLSVFRNLSMSRIVDGNTNGSRAPIPIINNCDDNTGNNAWKSIMLDSDAYEDWRIIKDHYLEANRLKKDKCMPLGSANGERG